MKFRIRRFPKVLLASAVLFAASFVSSPAQAAVEVNIACSGGGTFKVVDNMVMSSTTTCAGAVVIPANVTEFYGGSFQRSQVTSVTFEAGSKLKKMQGGVFYDTPLESIVLPNGMEVMDYVVFEYSQLKHITIPGTMKSMGGADFRNTPLETVVFESRTAPSLFMGGDMFDETPNLKSVTFKGPKQLQLNTFDSADSEYFNWLGWSTTEGGPVVSFPLANTNPGDLTLYPKRTPSPTAPRTVPCSLGGTFKIKDGRVVSSTSACVGTVVIPADVTHINGGVFGDRRITGVTFAPNGSLTHIDDYAFTRAKFSTISIPGTVTNVASNAFIESELETVFFESRVAATLSATNAFRDSSKLRSVHFVGPVVINNLGESGKGGFTKPDFSFMGWSLSEGGPIVTFPLTVAASNSATLYPIWTAKDVTYIACSVAGRFRIFENVVTSSSDDCAGQITIPANVKEVGYTAFSRREITNVTFQANSQLTTISEYAFEFSGISSIVFPNGLKTIKHGAFTEAKFSSISIPGTVENIEGYPFHTSELETVIFEPRIAQSLSISGAFGHSSKLRSVTFSGALQLNDLGEVQKDDFNWVGWSLSEGGPIVTFPRTIAASNSVTLYPIRTAKVITVTPCSLGGSFRSVDYVVRSSTDDCAGQITIPANVIEIAAWGTFENRNITSVVFEENSQLKKIGYYAFKNTKFTSIDLPTGLKEIHGGSFQSTALTSISIPGTVEWLEGSAFTDSSKLLTVIFEPRIASNLNIQYGGEAFNYNRSLRSVTFNGPLTLDNSPFYAPKRAYNWVGWSTTEGGPIATFPLTVTASNSVTLYPKYTPKTSVVTYDATGGSAVAPGSAVGEVIAFPTSPTRTGYTFDAWFDSPDDWSRGPVTYWERDDGATLYAKWNPNTYSVNLNTKGGSNVAAVSFVTDGEISSAPASPSRDGYSFTGWAATETGTALSFPYWPGVMENITLFAQWVKLAVVIEAGSTPNSQVVRIPAGFTEAVMPATTNVPSIKLGLAGTGGTAVATVVPTVNPTAPASTPFEAGSVKIVDINITGITGSVTICIEGASTDSLFHFTGGKWEELPQRSYANGQVCGVTSSFSPFAAAPRKKAAAPTNLSITRGDKSLSISFTPGATFGAEITRYEFSVDNGKTWSRVSGGDVKSPVTVGGLTNGMNYSVQLRAVNAAGSGADSVAVTGKPKEPLLADSSGIDVPIVKDPAVTFALNSDIAVRGNKVAVALVAPTSAKSKVTYYMFTMKPKTKGAAIVKQTYKAKAKGTTTAILTGKPKITYTVSVTAVYANGSRKSWTGPSLTTR
jgi:uncharacterized repeat protein (TIGR02543 family)